MPQRGEDTRASSSAAAARPAAAAVSATATRRPPPLQCRRPASDVQAGMAARLTAPTGLQAGKEAPRRQQRCGGDQGADTGGQGRLGEPWICLWRLGRCDQQGWIHSGALWTLAAAPTPSWPAGDI